MSFLSSLFGGGTNADGTTPMNVSAAEAITLVNDGAQLVDVREQHEWRSGHAKRAKHIPLGRISSEAERKLSKNKPVVAVCASGMRSRAAAKQMRAMGFSVANLKGGMAAWRSAGGGMA